MKNSYLQPLQADTFLTELIKNFHTFSFYHYKNKYDTRTIYLRIRNIEGFQKYLYLYYPTITNIKDIKEEHIIAFKEFCFYELKNDIKTINSKLTSLKYFFGYLSQNNYIDYNIALNVSKLKCHFSKEPRIFKTSELKVLFSEMEKLKYGIRDIVISKLILCSGLEIQDILSLKKSNIKLEEKEFTFNDKTYPIGTETIKNIKEYLVLRQMLNTNSTDHLFLSAAGSSYSIRSYQIAFKKAITNTTIDLNLTPRNLKMTFMFNMAKVTNEEVLKKITGQNKVEHYYKLLNDPLHTII